jgi:uncharacterized protein YeaO (DUF488 family)
MPIKEARAADVAVMVDSKSLGLRVLVMRKWPRMRGFNKNSVDYWIPDAGPSITLLEEYRKGGMAWSVFAERYIAEQRAATSCRLVRYVDGVKQCDVTVAASPLFVLQGLEEAHGLVRVICWEDAEKTDHHCHRFLLVDLAGERFTA